MSFDQLIRRIDRLESRLQRLVRVGTVTASFPDRGTVRVNLPDADNVNSQELPVLYPKTLQDKAYGMPDIGEHVLCVFLPIGVEQGFVIGAIYSQADPVPVSSQDKTGIEFADGAKFEYDRAANFLTIDVPGGAQFDFAGPVTLNAPELNINAPETNLEASTQLNVTSPMMYFVAATIASITAPAINNNGNLAIAGAISTTGGSGNATINGTLHATGNITSDGQIIDTSGNTANHTHPE
jgi:phage baseplate assembly protein V